MTIGELARRSGVKVSTLRFYERRGLLPPAGRTHGGYREYDEADVARVLYLRRGQELGFTLAELGGMLALSRSGTVLTGQVAELGRTKLAEIQTRIDDLERVREALAGLLEAQCIDPEAECPIVGALAASEVFEGVG